MTFGMILRTVFELALVIFTVWAVFHEDRFAAAEERLFARIRRKRLSVVRKNNLSQTAERPFIRRGI
ncbi:MAG: hypothetical protein IKI29_04375 [Clostridia bacterium]|nr:hypothetical protein [Clostridia bacterium]